MGILRRSSTVNVTVSPAILSPRQNATATVTTSSPIDKVTSATLDWGYTNFFRYHWAGRLDSAGNAGDDLIMLGQPGTNYGGDRNADEWVSVTKVDLPVANGEFTGGSSQLRIPSWAPASSDEIARWSCRLAVERDGRDIDGQGDFAVLVRAGDVEEDPAPLEHYDGSRETVVDIALPRSVFAAGEVDSWTHHPEPDGGPAGRRSAGLLAASSRVASVGATPVRDRSGRRPGGTPRESNPVAGGDSDHDSLRVAAAVRCRADGVRGALVDVMVRRS